MCEDSTSGKTGQRHTNNFRTYCSGEVMTEGGLAEVRQREVPREEACWGEAPGEGGRTEEGLGGEQRAEAPGGEQRAGGLGEEGAREGPGEEQRWGEQRWEERRQAQRQGRQCRP